METGESVATAVVSDLTLHEPGSVYPVVGVGEFGDVRGSIVLGSLDGLRSAVPAGSYSFAGAVLESSVVHPMLRGVRSIRAGSSTALSDPLYGIVKLVEGSNIRLTYVPSENAIRIDAVGGDKLSDECACAEAAANSAIKTINGVSVQGLQLKGDDCVEVSVSGNTITIRDKCSFPCCGCEEMDLITSRLQFLETAVRKIEALSSTMQSIIPSSLSALRMAVKTRGSISTSNVIA